MSNCKQKFKQERLPQVFLPTAYFFSRTEVDEVSCSQRDQVKDGDEQETRSGILQAQPNGR